VFTGIVGDLGRLARVSACGGGREFCFAASPAFLAGCRRGESIAVNGVCLTVSESGAESFSAFASGETLACTSLKSAACSALVHLERALELGGRFGGHIVTGHVDGTARVASVQRGERFLRVTLSLARGFLPLVAVKGSLAVDGVSLTVQDIVSDRVSFVIIPESLKRTTIGDWAAGREVNIELDILARYAARWLETGASAHHSVTDSHYSDGERAASLEAIMRANGCAAEIRRED